MNKREFNQLFSSCVGKDKKIDITLLDGLSESVKTSMVSYIVRNRGPVLSVLANRLESKDIEWLHACGYLYTTTGKESGLEFIHTCEHLIK